MTDQPNTPPMDADEMLSYIIGFLESLLADIDNVDKATIAYLLRMLIEKLNVLRLEDGEK